MATSSSASQNGRTLLGRSLFGGSPDTNRQLLIVALLFLSLLLASVFVGTPETDTPLDPDSAGPGGLLALHLWLEELGYDVARNDNAFRLTERWGNRNADLVFVYPNLWPYEEDESRQLKDWVEAGGTLVILGPDQNDTVLMEDFGINVGFDPGALLPFESQPQPLLPAPEDGWRGAPAQQVLHFEDAPETVPILVKQFVGEVATQGNEDAATVAARQLGEGVVWYLGVEHLLTNRALRTGDDARLIPAILRTVPKEGLVLFDTYHLFGTETSELSKIGSVQDWLYRTNLGRAVLLSFGLLFLFTILNGIRLGPALPLPESMVRREAAEYVTAMAGLQRRLGEPQNVADYQKRRLKLAIGRPINVASDLDDTKFMEEVRRRNRRLSESQLNEITEILVRLGLKIDEQALVRTCSRIDEILK